MTHVTCRLTAKNRKQLRNPTLGNRVWAISFIMQRLMRHDCVGHKDDESQAQLKSMSNATL